MQPITSARYARYAGWGSIPRTSRTSGRDAPRVPGRERPFFKRVAGGLRTLPAVAAARGNAHHLALRRGGGGAKPRYRRTARPAACPRRQAVDGGYAAARRAPGGRGAGRERRADSARGHGSARHPSAHRRPRALRRALRKNGRWGEDSPAGGISQAALAESAGPCKARREQVLEALAVSVPVDVEIPVKRQHLPNTGFCGKDRHARIREIEGEVPVFFDQRPDPLDRGGLL